MAYNNIEIETNGLSEIIIVLKKDNHEIANITKKIYDTFEELGDDKIWKTPEKKKYKEELMPYLKEFNEIITEKLSECTKQLNYALESYKQANKSLKREANKLTDEIEVL